MNSNQIVYLHSLLKTSLFRAWIKEALVFTFLVLRFILVHIYGPRKSKAGCPKLVFRRSACHFCPSLTPIVWRLRHIIDIWWYNTGWIFENSRCNARSFSFRYWKQIYHSKMNRTYARARGRCNHGVCICFVPPEAFEFYGVRQTTTRNRNQNKVKLENNIVIFFNLGVKCLFGL